MHQDSHESRERRCQLIRERFEALGVTIGDWADQRGYRRELVYSVLAGRVEGKRGTAHRIAVDLGIKSAPDTTDETNRRLLDRPGVVGRLFVEGKGGSRMA